MADVAALTALAVLAAATPAPFLSLVCFACFACFALACLALAVFPADWGTPACFCFCRVAILTGLSFRRFLAGGDFGSDRGATSSTSSTPSALAIPVASPHMLKMDGSPQQTFYGTDDCFMRVQSTEQSITLFDGSPFVSNGSPFWRSQRGGMRG